MKVLVVGGGGREHALAWKIRKSPHVTWVGVAPGNGGTRSLAETVEIAADDIEGMARYVHDEKIALTVIGPEAPLAAGLADLIEPAEQLVFGPSAAAARIESDKRFAKDLMAAAGIPTAEYRAFTDPGEADAYLRAHPGPVVVKASGLAAGKGVTLCRGMDEALAAVDAAMRKKVFGDAGSEIVIEELLEGPEASLLAITDGEKYLLLPPSQDHKRIGEGDTGPNTGGMGAYSPAALEDDDLLRRCAREIIEPALAALREAGTPYRGVLYVGLMLTEEGPKVLEFNCRFGDPETQAVLPLLGVDLVDLMLIAATGKLGEMLGSLSFDPIDWRRLSREGSAATVVLASEGYPGPYEKGREITGLPPEREDLVVFHAGTTWRDGRLYTSGGRVLAVTGLGKDLRAALANSYAAVEVIQFEGKTFRRDIGWRA
ncbi:MAG TPA: phosphoribosylamine--glycine ligase [Bacteroidetes bacterium]|nr:phosphoribosylamine--glycine ligase [Bacteroidota bacterium]